MHIGMPECHKAFCITLTLTSDLVLRIILSRVYLLYSLRQEFQIWCVYASWICGVSHTIFVVTVTLTMTSDLVLIIILSGVYLILFEIGIPNLVCGCILGWWSVLFHLLVTDLTSDLIFRIIMSEAYLLYY